MPCTKCEEGNYKWGETGECEYPTKEACESANSKFNKMQPTPLGKKTYEEYEKELKEFNLSKVERVDLGLMDDIKAQAKKLENAINKFGIDANKKVYQELVKKVKDLAKKSRTEIDSNYTKIYKEANVISPLMEKFIVAAKELGVENILKQPVFKNANDLLAEADEENKNLSKIDKLIREDYL
jgi:hypothetical protein